jgi:hypothetical protein
MALTLRLLVLADEGTSISPLHICAMRAIAAKQDWGGRSFSGYDMSRSVVHYVFAMRKRALRLQSAGERT